MERDASIGDNAARRATPPLHLTLSKRLAHHLGRAAQRLGLGPLRLAGQTFHVPAERAPIIAGRVLLGTYERPERRLLAQFLPTDGKVLELGGGLGVVSCFINARLELPEAHVVVECDPLTVRLLTANRALNGSRFTVVTGAVGRGDLRLVRRENPMSTYVEAETADGASVERHTIDALVRAHGVAFDCLVMDIEGGERRFVEEFEPDLERFRLVVLELHPALGPHGIDHVRGALKGAGLAHRRTIGWSEAWTR